MRVPVKAGLVLAAVTSLAACGSVAVPMASRLHVQHSGTQIVVARRGPPAGSRAEAVTLARLMLSRLRLPPGTRRLPLVPVPRPVSGPDLWAGAAAALDPEGYHVLAITVTIAGSRQHTVDKVVTSQAVITRLADALDRSPVQPVQVPNCPDIFAHYRLAFAISRRDPPGVVVLATRWPCGGAQIRAGGRSQPPLEDEGTVVAMADRLLGVTPAP